MKVSRDLKLEVKPWNARGVLLEQCKNWILFFKDIFSCCVESKPGRISKRTLKYSGERTLAKPEAVTKVVRGEWEASGYLLV